MAPLSDTFTQKYFMDYEGPNGKHTILFRFVPGIADADCKSRIIAVIGAMKAWMHTSFSFNVLRYSAPGSNVSFPTAWTPITGTFATAPTADMYPRFMSWVGRDSGGRRVRYTLIGASVNVDTDYRVLTSENSSVTAVLTQLRATGPSLVTKQGFVPIFNDYANVGYNAYFQRKRRKVG